MTRLSNQEQRVVRYSMAGLGDKEIAVEMAISVETIRTYWNRIREKLGGQTRAEIIAKYTSQLSDQQQSMLQTENEILLDEVQRRKAVEIELANQRAFFEGLAAHAGFGILSLDLEGVIEYANPAVSEILGYSHEELIGNSPLAFLAPNVLETRVLELQRMLETSESDYRNLVRATLAKHGKIQFLSQWVRKDGRRIDVRASLAQKLDGQGQQIGVITIVADVTKELEARRLFEAAALTTPSLIYIYDLVESRNVFSNRNIADLLGYSAQEVLEMGANLFPTIMHPDDMAAIAENLTQMRDVEDGEVRKTTYRCKRKSGEWRTLLSLDTPYLRDAEGKVCQIVGTAVDITEMPPSNEAFRGAP